MVKPPSVFILAGTGNPESEKEYDIIFVSVPSRSVNFLPFVRSLHPRLLAKLEPTFNFISPDNTSSSKSVCVYIILGCNIVIWQRIRCIFNNIAIHINSSNCGPSPTLLRKLFVKIAIFIPLLFYHHFFKFAYRNYYYNYIK